MAEPAKLLTDTTELKVPLIEIAHKSDLTKITTDELKNISIENKKKYQIWIAFMAMGAILSFGIRFSLKHLSRNKE